MRITQGTFSYLPDLTDDQIRAQIQYCIDHDWPISIEYTDDPHPRNVYWDMFGLPMFDLKDPAAIMQVMAVSGDLPEPLHPGQRLRPLARTGHHRPPVHREPARVRAWLLPGSPGDERPPDSLHHSLVRG